MQYVHINRNSLPVAELARVPRGIGSARRRAFTLIEILVVVAIIAVLVALVGAAIWVWVPTQQSRSTQATMRTVKKIFDEQWAYVVEQAKKESPSTFVAQNVGSDPTGERARALWIKVRLIEAFPISYDEVNNSNNAIYQLLNAAIPGTPGQPQRKSWDTYQKYLNKNFASPPRVSSAQTTNSESSACLLMALLVSRGGSVLSSDQLGPYIVDSDGDGVNEIIDGWRSPLVFYRFAWGSVGIPGNPGAPSGIQGLNPAPANSKTAKLCDPLDPGGQLLSWAPGASRTTYETFVNQIAVGGKGVTQPPANYVIPVIMSLGADQDMVKGVLTPSLFSPTQCATAGLTVQNAATAGDNIYSFNLTGN